MLRRMQLLERIDIFPSRVLQAEKGEDERSLESGSSGENAAKSCIRTCFIMSFRQD